MASKSLGTLTVDLIAKIGGFVSGMTQAEKAAAKSAREIEKKKREMAKRLDNIYKGIRTTAVSAFTAIGVAATAAITMAIKSGIEEADKFDEIANRLQVSVEKFQGLNYAAKLSGLDTSDLETALPKLSKAMAEAQEEGSKFDLIFKQLGISVTDSTGKLRPAIDVLLELTDRFKSYDDATGEAALSMELFGKSGAKFLEFLNRGSEDINGLMQRAEELGLIIGDDTAAKLAEFNDRLDELKIGMTVLGAEIASQLVPEILNMIKNFQEWKKEGKAAADITEILKGTIDVLKVSLNVVGIVFESLKVIIGTFIQTLGSVIEMIVRFAQIVDTVFTKIVTFNWRGITAEINKGYSEIARINRDGGNAVVDMWKTGAGAIKDHAVGAWNTLNGTLTESEKASSRAVSAQEKVSESISTSTNLISRQASGVDAFTGKVNQSTQAVAAWGKEQKEVNASMEKAEEIATSTGRIVPKSLFGAGEKETKTGGGKGGASSRSKEISAEEKELERLNEKYNDIIAGYDERIYMIGKEGELAKVTYETTYGALKNLTQAQKENVLAGAEMLDLAEEQNKLDQKRRDDYESDKKNAEEIISYMEFQVTLLGKTIEEQERLNLVRQLGTNIEQEMVEKAEAALRTLQEAQIAMARQIEIADQFRSSASDLFYDLATGAKGFKEAALDALNAINQRIMRMIADNWAEKLFGQFGSAGGGAGGGWLNTFASMLFGGGKATGGWALPNTMYRVNEHGPEMLSVKGKDFLMMGDSGGSITPNHMIKGQGGFTQNNNFVIQGKIDRRTEMQIAQESGRRAQAAQARNN